MAIRWLLTWGMQCLYPPPRPPGESDEHHRAYCIKVWSIFNANLGSRQSAGACRSSNLPPPLHWFRVGKRQRARCSIFGAFTEEHVGKMNKNCTFDQMYGERVQRNVQLFTVYSFYSKLLMKSSQWRGTLKQLSVILHEQCLKLNIKNCVVQLSTSYLQRPWLLQNSSHLKRFQC